MRKPFLAGNWKMNNTINESVELVKGLVGNVGNITDRDILVAPPFTALTKVKEIIKDSNIKLGAQNCSFAEKGAYTGEVSPTMLLDAGCEYVILGHSERRQYFGEDNEIIKKKMLNALSVGLKIIYCVGETLAEREANKTFDVIESQIKEGLNGVPSENITIAYEPVWAIGTGKTATPDQAEEVHAFIRGILEKIYDKNVADDMQILYGGSVSPDTIKNLMACPNVDGGLVGGASLKVDSFSKIVEDAK